MQPTTQGHDSDSEAESLCFQTSPSCLTPGGFKKGEIHPGSQRLPERREQIARQLAIDNGWHAQLGFWLLLRVTCNCLLLGRLFREPGLAVAGTLGLRWALWTRRRQAACAFLSPGREAFWGVAPREIRLLNWWRLILESWQTIVHYFLAL